MLELVELNSEGQACLVLIHGTAGSPLSTWGRFAGYLDGEYRLLAVDLSRLDQWSTVEKTLEDLGKLIAGRIRDCVVERFHLVGYSLGAALAVEVARLMARQVHSLTLIAPFDNGLEPQVRRTFDYWQRLLEDHPRKLAAEIVTRGFSISWLGTLSAVQVATCIYDFYQRVHWPGVAAQMKLNRALDVSSQARQLQCPTAVIVGRDDRLIPTTVSIALHRQLLHGYLYSLPGGHLMPAEDPLGLARIVQHFIARHTSTARFH
ncbi:alpha/beta hydrolase [Pseudomonas sp. R4-84]